MIPLLYERLRLPVLLFAGVFFGGTLGYWAIGRTGAAGGAIPAPWPLLDCAFMTTITLTTIGYGDVLYVVSETTSFFVEGHLGRS